VAGWCFYIEQKISELQNTVFQSSLSFVGPQARTRLLHLRGRLRHLTESGIATSARDTAAVDKLRLQLEDIERVMESVEQ
jgi:hypothetical protein